MGFLSMLGIGKKKSLTGLGQEFEDRLQTYLRMVNMTESQIPHQSGHSERVAGYTRLIVARMNLSDDEAERFVLAAQLHDVGKVALSGVVLGADGQLTRYQVAELRRHPLKGAEMLQGLGHDNTIVQGVLYHHERWDGSGYPEGLKGEEIPLVARVVGVADVFEALTSQRSYRKAYAVENALQHVKDGAGKLYDPDVASILLEQWANAPERAGQDWVVEKSTAKVMSDTAVTRLQSAESA